MDFEDAKADALVAGVAAACTVTLSLGLEYGLGVDAGTLLRVSPLAAYAAYLFGGRLTGEPRVREWILVTLVVTAGAFAYAVVG